MKPHVREAVKQWCAVNSIVRKHYRQHANIADLQLHQRRPPPVDNQTSSSCDHLPAAAIAAAHHARAT